MIALEVDEHALLNEALRHQHCVARVAAYFFEEMKLREIGETLGVTESRLSIRSEALNQRKSARAPRVANAQIISLIRGFSDALISPKSAISSLSTSAPLKMLCNLSVTSTCLASETSASAS